MKMQILPKPDYTLLGIVLILLVFGLLTLSSASSVIAHENFGNNNYYFFRQLMFGVVPGLIAMYFASKIHYLKWQTFAPLFVIIGILLLLAVFIPGVGFGVGSSNMWIDLKYFLFQPSELMKLVVIIYLASWYDKRAVHAQDLYYGFLPSLAIVGLIAGLIILQPDLGTMIILCLIAATMFFIGGVKLKYLFSVSSIGAIFIWIMVKAAPYRLNRITAFFNPEIDTRGISYQINQALLAIGSGGLWGYGLGQSRQKYNYLPETIGDSIFAVMAEEMGFVRITIVLLLFLLLAFRGFKIAKNAPDTFSKLVTVGITSWIIIQAIINIGGITAVIPLTGVPLPFISYGSTAMVVSLLGIGILLNISRYSVNQKDI
ncbi:MAG: putative lipid II flippase FtsW [Candidatus Doudnabacteria bacterium]|nr:putative lipid II flippase FtsW [Candidatus Doudnabacteria bacterium]